MTVGAQRNLVRGIVNVLVKQLDPRELHQLLWLWIERVDMGELVGFEVTRSGWLAYSLGVEEGLITDRTATVHLRCQRQFLCRAVRSSLFRHVVLLTLWPQANEAGIRCRDREGPRHY